ncbi:MAG: D-alanyl-D-alanine carboxypeptidase family protein [Ruminococcus sp.]|nr:D-alanyl-D-alanine carboxypeptidase family protein [Ruminococcus sp.]
MDNNENTHRPRKRVTKKMVRCRRMAALAIILLIFILGIILIAHSCSSDGDSNSDATPKATQPITVVTTAVATEPVQTTTTIVPSTFDVELSDTIFYLEIGDTDISYINAYPDGSAEANEDWSSSDESVATVDSVGHITAVGAGECYITLTFDNNTSVYAEVKVVVTDPDGGDTTQATTEAASVTQTANSAVDIQEIDGITYVNGILIVNKTYDLPSTYNPGLDSETQAHFDELVSVAAEEGLNIYLASGYRSYEYQSQIYTNYSNLYGSETADTFSARPRHSEHQTGLAIDVNSIDDSFAGTPEAIWLAEHAHEFGFIIRYPEGKEDITGYKYEPWHIRYLGVETATAVYNSGLTLEEYLGIDSVYQD